MAEKDDVFGSKIKFVGLFDFKEFYAFCYEWLSLETGLTVVEEEYSEKLKGNMKDIEVKWVAFTKASDYFKYEIKIEFKLIAITEVEIVKDGVKMKMNKGEIGMKVKGILIKDYDGKFETNATMKVWRGIYEKWVISQRVKSFEDKLVGKCADFIGEAKAFLDLSGRT